MISIFFLEVFLRLNHGVLLNEAMMSKSVLFRWQIWQSTKVMQAFWLIAITSFSNAVLKIQQPQTNSESMVKVPSLVSTPKKDIGGTNRKGRLKTYSVQSNGVSYISFIRNQKPKPGPVTKFERVKWSDEQWRGMEPSFRDRWVHNMDDFQWPDMFAGMGARKRQQTGRGHSQFKFRPLGL